MGYRSIRDQVLLEHAILDMQQGKSESISVIYQILYHPLFSYTFAMTKQHHSTEDVLQDVFLKIHRNCSKYQKGTNVRAWIYQICHNETISYLKKQHTELTLETETLTYTIDLKYQTKQTDLTFVEETLSILTDIEKQIVTLYLYAGLRHTEISQVLKIPYEKVRSTYSYALTKIRNYLKRGAKT